MSKNVKTILSEYVPRHLRLGICQIIDETSPIVHDVQQEVPIIGDDGLVIERRFINNVVPAHETLSKYNVNDFRLDAMLEAGVPLKVVNVVSSRNKNIDDIVQIASKLDDLDKYAAFVDKQNKEYESFFVESSNNDK